MTVRLPRFASIRVATNLLLNRRLFQKRKFESIFLEEVHFFGKRPHEKVHFFQEKVHFFLVAVPKTKIFREEVHNH